MKVIEPSASIKMAELAASLKNEGKTVLNLSIGEPNFTPANHICKAAKDSMDRGETGYASSQGIPALRGAIAGKRQTIPTWFNL